LEKVVTSAETTPEQKSAAKDLITQVQTKGLGGAMGGTGDVTNRVTGGFTNQIHRGADKATDELQKPFKQ
jgi:hypothetical protein